MRKLIVLLCAAALSGCGIAAKINARDQYQQSLEAYKACLAQNAANPNACEADRLALQADQSAYQTMSAGITPNGNHSVVITSTGN